MRIARRNSPYVSPIASPACVPRSPYQAKRLSVRGRWIVLSKTLNRAASLAVDTRVARAAVPFAYRGRTWAARVGTGQDGIRSSRPDVPGGFAGSTRRHLRFG